MQSMLWTDCKLYVHICWQTQRKLLVYLCSYYIYVCGGGFLHTGWGIKIIPYANFVILLLFSNMWIYGILFNFGVRPQLLSMEQTVVRCYKRCAMVRTCCSQSSSVVLSPKSTGGRSLCQWEGRACGDRSVSFCSPTFLLVFRFNS